MALHPRERRRHDGLSNWGRPAPESLVSEPVSNNYVLEAIRVPTLLLHAPDDPLADYQRAVNAAARVPGARLVTIPSGRPPLPGQCSGGPRGHRILRVERPWDVAEVRNGRPELTARAPAAIAPAIAPAVGAADQPVPGAHLTRLPTRGGAMDIDSVRHVRKAYAAARRSSLPCSARRRALQPLVATLGCSASTSSLDAVVRPSSVCQRILGSPGAAS